MSAQTKLTLLSVTVAATIAACVSAAEPRRHLLIVVDGLRPDYVTADVMPNLTALGKRGVVFNRHHSVYPTVTRVNASSISTGAYPERHGLMGNSVFFPRVDPRRFLDTADRNALMKIAEVEGKLLTAPTLGEWLQAAGRKMLVVSSGSGGSAFLNNHTLSGGAILHYQYVMPQELRAPMDAIGPAPPDNAPDDARDTYAVDALLKVGIPRVDPSVTVLWLGALDSVAHEKGIGAPETVAILRHVDREIKRVQDGLRAAGRFDDYNIWVTSDHGFSTYTGGINVGELLKPFAGSLADGSPRVVSGGGAVYVRDGDEAAIAAIAKKLQQTPGVGAIFTRAATPGSFDGRLPGTLSFDAVHWNHERAAQILYSPDWTDSPNAYGVRGTSASSGTAGHGSCSPWDIHNTLIAAGPDLKRGVRIDSPSANVDFAPTFLHLLGLAIPASVQGRSLNDALVNGTALPRSAVRRTEHAVATPDGAYTLTAIFSTVTAGGREYRYLDETRVFKK
jgi:predicted AlkP superfamily pyrophosphatase or phosphodiesterase